MSRDGKALPATPSQTVGPFFHVGLSAVAMGAANGGALDGEPIRLRIVVTDGDRQPVGDGLVEIWHAGPAAEHPAPPAAVTQPAVSRFGRMPTGCDGSCEFETVGPGRVPEDRGVLQAAHVNICLFARGLLRPLYTRLYFAGDPALEDDAVLALVPEDRRATLIAQPDPGRPGVWLFEMRLQGPQETVFFDA